MKFLLFSFDYLKKILNFGGNFNDKAYNFDMINRIL